METVSVLELDSRFDELLGLAELGEEIIITRDGREIARFIPPRRYFEEDVPVPMRGFGQ